MQFFCFLCFFVVFVFDFPHTHAHTKLQLSGRIKGAILEEILIAMMLLEENNKMEDSQKALTDLDDRML